MNKKIKYAISGNDLITLLKDRIDDIGSDCDYLCDLTDCILGLGTLNCKVSDDGEDDKFEFTLPDDEGECMFPKNELERYNIVSKEML